MKTNANPAGTGLLTSSPTSLRLLGTMPGLMPKLRAATSDAEKATLQNAVTATDHQIDHLVYELYGLTPEEIQLVDVSQ